MNKVIASPHAPKAVGPYSQAIQAEGTLYPSGQLPIDGATGTMPETIEEQTEQSLKNVGHLQSRCGGLVGSLLTAATDQLIKSRHLISPFFDSRY